jgi:hypothetical protein
MNCELCDSILGKEFSKVSDNPKRCKNCEFTELNIKQECFLCLKRIKNDLKYYKINGNMCQECNNNINLTIKGRRYRNIVI